MTIPENVTLEEGNEITVTQTDEAGNIIDIGVIVVTVRPGGYKLTIQKLLFDQNGNPIVETKNFKVRVNGPSYPDGLELSIHTYEDTVLLGLVAGTYEVTVLDEAGYRVTVSDPVTIGPNNPEDVIIVSGYLLTTAETTPDKVSNVIAKTGENNSPLMAMSFLIAGAALIFFKRKSRRASHSEDA